MIRTDAIKLKVIIKNLLANAVKFTWEGSIGVAAHACDDGVEIIVSDTGAGIAEDLQQVIFEPYYQVRGVGSGRSEGVGLGLYVVQRLLELIGGSISVASEVGRGSTFRVHLSTDI